jgi:hypothetical protein
LAHDAGLRPARRAGPTTSGCGSAALGILIVIGISAPLWPAWAAEVADPRQARLEVEEGSGTGPQTGLSGKLTKFNIQTGTAEYQLAYVNPAERAADGPYRLGTYSGYGMLQPAGYWFWESFVNLCSPRPQRSPFCLGQVAATPVIRERRGDRVAYDLLFQDQEARVAIRTVALGGRAVLVLAIDRSGAETPCDVIFWGYPQGMTGPFDRCVHVGPTEYRNRGTPGPQDLPIINYDLDLQPAPWVLMTDHGKEGQPGQLGLVFDRQEVRQARVAIEYNFYMRLTLTSAPGARPVRLVMATFTGMTSQEAAAALGVLAEQAPELWARALGGLPAPFDEVQ